MKKALKRSLSLLLAITIIFGSMYVGLSEVDFSGLFVVKANAASTSDLTFNLNSDSKSYSVTDCNSSASGSLTIPSTYNGKPVTNIDDRAFELCKSLTLITIPDSVTSIGSSAFQYCTSLTSITIPDGVTTIGKSTFDFCTSLTSIAIPDSVTSIGSSAFYWCKSLDSITIPNSVTSIGEKAFYNCDSLNSITIPDSVTSIGNSAFSYCKSLTDVYYGGLEVDWGNISIGSDNSYLENAIIHYHEHSCNSEWIVDIEPTCTEAGSKHNTCLECGNVVTEDIPASHNYGDWIITTAPTCTENGSKSRHCSNCEARTDETVISAYGHDYSGWETTIHPTCEEDGYMQMVCYLCGDVVSETLYATGHNSSDWIIEREPTYDKEGYQYKYCYTCYKTVEEETIPVLIFVPCGHGSTRWVCDVDSTCTEIGYGHFECEYCGEYLESGTIPVKEHNPSEWVVGKVPTCTDDGYEYIYCTYCFITIEEGPLLPFGHNYSEWYYESYPSCISSGSKYRFCYNCNEYEYCELPSNNRHEYSEWYLIEQPTCTENGVAIKNCYACGGTLNSSEISSEYLVPSDLYPESSHNYDNNICERYEFFYSGATELTLTFSSDTYTESNWDYIQIYDMNGSLYNRYTGSELAGKQITLTGDGFYIELTSDGGTTYYGFSLDSIVAHMELPYDLTNSLGHSYSEEFTVDTEPTCTASGSKSRHCIRCDEKTDITTIEANGHSYGDWIVDIEPSCTEEGSRHKECSVCGDVIIEAINPLGHSYSTEWTIDVAPTCTEMGSKSHHCTVCDSKGDITSIAVVGHSYEVIDALVHHPHTITSKCSVCLSTKTEPSVESACVECNFTITTIDANSYKLVSYIGTETNVVIPATYNGRAITTVGNSCFKGNTTIKSVEIADGVTAIGSLVFMNCSSLEKVVIPASVTSIGTQAFYGFKGTIYCQKDSYAHEYAVTNNIKYVLLSIKETENTKIDYENLVIHTSVQGCADISGILGISETTLAISTASYVYGNLELLGTGTVITVFDGNEYIGDFTLVVEGDTNGDSVCDALDAMQVGLASNGHRTLDGAYALAADSNADDIVDANDYQAIVNKAVA